jgi:hypothetical protein
MIESTCGAKVVKQSEALVRSNIFVHSHLEACNAIHLAQLRKIYEVDLVYWLNFVTNVFTNLAQPRC